MKFLPEVLFSYRWHAANTIKQTERICHFEQKTRAHENSLLLSLSTSSMTEEVREVCLHGAVYKSGGIRHLFEWNKRKGPKGRFLEITFFSAFRASFKRG